MINYYCITTNDEKTVITNSFRHNTCKIHSNTALFITSTGSSVNYGNKTWTMKVEGSQRLEIAERMLVRYMCGVSMKNRKTSEELRQRLELDSVPDI